jgi:hypothetical protein
MFTKFHRTALLIGCCSLLHSLNGHPVTFKGGTQLTLNYAQELQSMQLQHSYTHRTAYGLMAFHFDRPDLRRSYLTAGHNWLGKRWLLPHAQGNFYYGMGAGMSSDPDRNSRTSAAAVAFVQLDYETRRIYTAWQSQLLIDRSDAFTKHSAAVGFAPYLAEFDELNTWLLLRAEYITDLSDAVDLTPTLRFFYDQFFWELGITTDGEVRGMFMMHF